MITIIPATQNSEQIRYQLYTIDSSYDIVIDLKRKFMEAFEMTYNEESGDWNEREISPSSLTDELGDFYVFAGVSEKPATINDLLAMFTSTLFLNS